MKKIWWIMGRDLSALLRSPIGYIILACALVIDGLLFNAWAVGGGQRRSSEVIEVFFYCASGTTLLACVFVSMGLIAEERQRGTWVLLATSPVAEYQLALAKFLAGFTFVALLTALTAYMPALVMWNGKVSLGHLGAGYLGLLLLASAALGLGLLCSAAAPNQLVAAISSAAVITTFILFWLTSRIASPPLEDLLAYLSLHDKHFRPFMRGLISAQDVVFYLSLTALSVLGATRILESKRWQ